MAWVDPSAEVSLSWGILDCHAVVQDLETSSYEVLTFASPEGSCSRKMMVMDLLSMREICMGVDEGYLVPSLDCGTCCPASPQDHVAAWSLVQMTTCISIKQ